MSETQRQGAVHSSMFAALVAWRVARVVLAPLLLALAVTAVLGKLWLDASGPFVEALPAYPYCREAAIALADERVAEALELAEVGACEHVAALARARWDALSAQAQRCWEGVWSGRGEDAFAIGCAVASDLVVFGDVRDLTIQALAWGRGDATDSVLVALSSAGLVLTFTPQLGAGTALLKAARRAGALSTDLALSVTRLVRRQAWPALAHLLTDAGRISTKLGPAQAARALRYADDATELATLARFVEAAPHPLVALRLGGKRVAAIADDGLYRAALARGPAALELAAERGTRALLSRQPLLVWAAKSVYKHPDALAEALLALAAWVLRWATWPVVLLVAAVSSLTSWVLWPRRRRARRVRRNAPSAYHGGKLPG